MLSLKNIVKEYKVADQVTTALKGVSIDFRENEFVSVLGQSGCGKTTLLNIIGGLDRYTSGDLIINGVSTKEFKNRDWDTYRNHSVGFVFQSYNLIPHQTVLANVELALTLSGVSKSERKRRATEALEKVGLGDQLHKKPNQMSGGQMQRVAIARALVNDPDILLADEPTGALDSNTSIQVMEILKEVAQDKLVIMVTHNPELAEKYSTRIIKLLDGKIISDTSPIKDDEALAVDIVTNKDGKKRKKQTTMSFFTALGLSFNNLMTKKARTLLTSFAGSIGIIGIALILAISNGVQLYIDKVQEDTLSGYPLSITESTMDLTSMMTSMMGAKSDGSQHGRDKIYSNDIMTDMLSAMSKGVAQNDLAEFKKYLESKSDELDEYVTDIKYGYSTQMNIYKADTSDGVYQVNPGQVMESLGFNTESTVANAKSTVTSSMTNTDVWQELISNKELLESQYDVIAGKMPENYDEAVVIVDKNNEISDYTLYTLGLRDDAELKEMFEAIQKGEKFETQSTEYTYDEILGLRFKLLINTDYFEKTDNGYEDRSDDRVYMISKLNDATEIKIVGILRPSEDASATAVSGSVAYLPELTQYLINRVNDSEIVKEQKQNEDVDVFTGLEFKSDEEKVMTADELKNYISTLPAEQQAQMQGYITQMRNSGMSEEQILKTFSESINKTSSTTYEENLKILGCSDLNEPSSVNIYPKDFASKDRITEIIDEYNSGVDEANKITYTDYIGIMMSSVTTIINAISYILIAFVAISLVVSSIMIGIITYISVLERTKEIGILRAIGASKRDISRVFNAETLIVGFVSGVLGIGITLLLTIPINAIIANITQISAAASLPAVAAVVLVAISMFLTFIAGLVPSKIAAKKDPVVALRSE